MTEELELEQEEQYDVFRNYQEQVLPKSLHTFFQVLGKKNPKNKNTHLLSSVKPPTSPIQQAPNLSSKF